MLNAILVSVCYLGLLFLAVKLSGVKYTDIVKSTHNILYGLLIPVGVCTLILTSYAWAVGWLPGVLTFAPRQTNILLWAAPFVMAIGIVLRLALFRRSPLEPRAIVYLVIGTFAVGFSEELLVRGIVVGSLQESGYSVLMVGILSSLLFGVLHFMNYFNGQDLQKTAIQVVGTILMGLNFFMLYVASGTLWLPILMHFVYDFSILFLGPEPELESGNAIRDKLLLAASVAVYIVPLGLLFLL